MEYDEIIRQLVDAKINELPDIDVNVYESGMRALALKLSTRNEIGRFYTNSEIETLREECYLDGFEDGLL